ncbi:hypothetical protein Hanom_Chr07g00632381 [Helianthus anomalus]
MKLILVSMMIMKILTMTLKNLHTQMYMNNPLDIYPDVIMHPTVLNLIKFIAKILIILLYCLFYFI